MLLGGVSDHMPGRLPQQIRDSPSYYDHGIYAHVADIFASHDLHYSSDDSGQFCFEVIPTNEGYTIEGNLEHLNYDGQESAVALVQDEGDHTLVVEGRPYVLRLDKEKAGREWCSAVDPSKWYVYKRGSSK